MALASRDDLHLKWDLWPERLGQVLADRIFEPVSRMDFHRGFYQVLEQDGGLVQENWECVVLSAKVERFRYWRSRPRECQRQRLIQGGRT